MYKYGIYTSACEATQSHEVWAAALLKDKFSIRRLPTYAPRVPLGLLRTVKTLNQGNIVIKIKGPSFRNMLCGLKLYGKTFNTDNL